jgi:hypothetical protein
MNSGGMPPRSSRTSSSNRPDPNASVSMVPSTRKNLDDTPIQHVNGTIDTLGGRAAAGPRVEGA